jgi:nucleotide-binding universal stress UspA family protein
LDRQTLGSTAEFLLRAVPCPTLTYGPNVLSTFDLFSQRGPILVPISLPCNPDYLDKAISISRLFGAGIEILHVAAHASSTAIRDLECECQELSYRLRSGGVHAQWSLYCGLPDNVIRSRAAELNSPFILMPLRWGHRLSSMTSDNVAAHVIRCCKVPVMTYRTS